MGQVIAERSHRVPANEHLYAIAKSLARECQLDFVGLPTVLAAVKQSMPKADAEETREATLEVARFILEDPDLVVGQITDTDFEE